MQAIYQNIFKTFVFSSIVFLLIGVFMTGQAYLTMTMISYFLLAFAFLFIIFVVLVDKINTNTSVSGLSNFLFLLSNYSAFLFIFAFIGFILYMLIVHKKRIEQGNLSSGYYTFSNINIFLILCQLYIVYKNITINTYNPSETVARMTTTNNMILYLLCLLLFMSVFTLYSILTYFTTDG